MKLSRRAVERLRELQASVEELAVERNRALRMFLSSRVATTAGTQREFWMEFSWADQEYRAAVRALAQFCDEHRLKLEGPGAGRVLRDPERRTP